MKRTCSLLLSTILILTIFTNFNKIEASASTAIYGVGKVTTASTNLNVRSSASSSAPIKTSLKRNSFVTLINKSGNFWYVKYSASGYGYCSADYITVASNNVKTVKTTSGNLNVRSSASTSGTILTRLSTGTKVPIISTSNGWSKILYNGTKIGYVSSSYLVSTTTSTPTKFKAISLSGVPNFKQTDSRWANVTLGNSGQPISRIGCAVTAISMLESKRTNSTIYPHQMAKKLSFTSGGAVYWPSYYTQITTSANYLTKIYNLLEQGKPIIVGAKKSNGSQHYVVVTGVKATNTLTTSSFFINDPGSNTRTTLNQFFNSYPYFYKMLHY